MQTQSIQNFYLGTSPHKGLNFFVRWFLFACLSLSLNANAGLFDDDEARKAILDLRAKLEAQTRELQSKDAELSGRTDQLEQTVKGILQLQNQLQLLRDEMAKLRGQVEVQTNEIATFQKTILDQRELIAATEGKLKKFEPQVVQVDGKNISVEANEKRRYDSAIGLVRAGDFKSALANLNQFQVAYPDSGYMPSVLYWIGSSQYALKDYKAAIGSLQSLITGQPDYPRTPDALLTMGLAQIESGDRRTGRRTLEIIIERYGDSPIAQSAKERLATLRP
jgi:tol-pal system protein YbgF